MAQAAFAEDEAVLIHNAIHSGAGTVDLGHGEVYPITQSKNKCRRVDARGWTFMEQNRNKDSGTARRARSGEKLTWVMKSGEFHAAMGSWGLIENGKVTKNPNKAIRVGEFVGVGGASDSAFKAEHSGGTAPQAMATYASDAPAAAIARPLPTRLTQRRVVVKMEAADPTSLAVPAAAAADEYEEQALQRPPRPKVSFDVAAGKRETNEVRGRCVVRRCCCLKQSRVFSCRIGKFQNRASVECPCSHRCRSCRRRCSTDTQVRRCLGDSCSLLRRVPCRGARIEA